MAQPVQSDLPAGAGCVRARVVGGYAVRQRVTAAAHVDAHDLAQQGVQALTGAEGIAGAVDGTVPTLSAAPAARRGDAR